MKAVSFEMSLPRIAAARIAGLFSPAGFVARSVGPAPRSPDRVAARRLGRRAATRHGYLRERRQEIFLDASIDNPLRALISFPHVLGHEVAATVVEAGPAVRRVRVGDRVAVSPWLPCEVRGLPLCRYCQQGDLSLCDSFTVGDIAPGMHAGNCRDVPGAYAELMVAHESMCFAIPDGVPDEQAALADPFSVALHAIRKAPPAAGETALVYGCGPLGMMTIHALAKLYPGTRILAVDLHDYLRPFALTMGAHEYFAGQGAALIEQVAKATSAKIRKVRLALPGSRAASSACTTRSASPPRSRPPCGSKPLGTVVLVGVRRRAEWTPIFFREVSVIGSNAYGAETFDGERSTGSPTTCRRAPRGGWTDSDDHAPFPAGELPRGVRGGACEGVAGGGEGDLDFRPRRRDGLERSRRAR
jgi:threonine dehydrogenase-like Zn-dependent dehydrogenase